MNGILIFGDSITAGRGVAKEKSWTGRLSRVFDKKDKDNFIVYNLGIPGESTAELLKRFEIECQSRTYRQCPDDSFIVVINIGLNDSKYINSSNNPKTPKDIFRKNISKLINAARRYTKKVIFVGLTPVNEKKTAPLGNVYFLNKRVEIYNNVIKDCCNKHDILFINLFKYWFGQSYKRFLSDDGLHPNEVGHRKIFEKIIKYF